jgi:perosamine synthetase
VEAARDDRWQHLAQAHPRSRPLPGDVNAFTQWRARVRAAVGVLAGPVSGPAVVVQVNDTAADGLRWAEYVVERSGAGQFRVVLTTLDAPGHRGPAVVVCPGRHAVTDQVTGQAAPDYPDRPVAALLARAGFVTATLDYGLDGNLGQRTLAGRDEASVLHQMLALAGRPLLGVLAWDALSVVDWLVGRISRGDRAAQAQVGGGQVALFGHSLGAAVALHAGLLADVPLPVCTASHLGTHRVIAAGHAALTLPGIGRHADLSDLYAALAPAPLQVQYGLRDTSLDPADAESAGKHIRRLYRVAGCHGMAQVHALPMGHGTDVAQVRDFLDRVIGDQAESVAAEPALPPVRIVFDHDMRQRVADDAVDILASGTLTLGAKVAAFERELQLFTGRPMVAVDSGSSALEIALRRIGVAGRVVLVPVNTFFATAAASVRAGARVDFVDLEPTGLGLAPASLAELLSRHGSDVAAVVVMHTGGIVAPSLLGTLSECRRRGIPVIEDAAHAFGSSLDGRMAGSIADFGTYSFYPTKVLTAGEGGAVSASAEEDLADFRRWRDHGRTGPGLTTHDRPGSNWRMSEFHASVGRAHLAAFTAQTAARALAAARYDEELADLDLMRVYRLPPGVSTSWYKYIAMLADDVDRAALKARLRDRHGVRLAGEVYDLLLTDQPYFAAASGEREFPGARHFADRHICLPLYPDMTEAEQDRVIGALRKELS